MNYSLFSKCIKHKGDIVISNTKYYEMNVNNGKMYFLHENRLLTNLLHISGKKEWIIIYKIDKLYVELSCYIFLPVFILRKHKYEKENNPDSLNFFSSTHTVLSVILQLTAVRMGLAFKWGQSPKGGTLDLEQWMVLTQRQ